MNFHNLNKKKIQEIFKNENSLIDFFNVNNNVKNSKDISNDTLSKIADKLGYTLQIILVPNDRVKCPKDKFDKLLVYNDNFLNDLEKVSKECKIINDTKKANRKTSKSTKIGILSESTEESNTNAISLELDLTV